nr:MAG TPA: hypothetical protein [Bacteriophage sp.]
MAEDKGFEQEDFRLCQADYHIYSRWWYECHDLYFW